MSGARHFVVATAGHVDHGKSTLVRALTGMEPDRLAEERARGLSIELGFVWTGLDDGRVDTAAMDEAGSQVAFVDVPGHERFVSTMLTGLGPAPAVLLVVAADEGWSAQTSEHRDAIAALGISHGLVALTAIDRPGADVEAVTERVLRELEGTSIAHVPVIPVSAVTGDGLPALRQALAAMLATIPAPDPRARLRIWLDRSFTIRGAGTVVTGTLAAGGLRVGDALQVAGERGEEPAIVRGLQRQGGPEEQVGPTSRVAVNLRGVASPDVHRGDALLTPGAWPFIDTLDVRRTFGHDLDDAPEEVMVHVGSAAVAAHLRPLGADHARLTLARRLPLTVTDALVVRDPGARRIHAGVSVLDPDPPAFTRRGDAARWTAQLAAQPLHGDAAPQVERRGAVRPETLQRWGFRVENDRPPAGVSALAGWWVAESRLRQWTTELRELVEVRASEDPLSAGVTAADARSRLGLPSDDLLAPVVGSADLVERGGVVQRRDATSLGPAEAAVSALEGRLRESPFAAPEADDLTALGLGARELAAAERTGRLLRLQGGVVVLPDAPARAMRVLATLPESFTLSEARQALGVSRRVAVPLLEHLDTLGWTRRLDGQRRAVRR